ncbi:MAG: biopolymer transporter ExbD, partial [Leptotrichiaceae bacterium]|nr:biopolymer transporter ExbD [Leptotrichiaceae bacterium]MBP9538610.1 biopolymer transporter ExbD [Leptotrichiaceae bacterium]
IYFFVCGGNSFKNQIYKVNLPTVKKSIVNNTENKYKSITFISSNKILIDSSDKKVFTVKLNELDRYLSNKDEVLLSIDKSTEYKNVIEIIDKLKSIGITKINLNSMSEGEKL